MATMMWSQSSIRRGSVGKSLGGQPGGAVVGSGGVVPLGAGAADVRGLGLGSSDFPNRACFLGVCLDLGVSQ